ncbi:MAG: AMP-binding protein, partial [Phycisphaerales bacterium]|nr:AMP-binding protein [Phycisphaerales bacterium]
MSDQNRFRCALIGTGSVLTQCGDELRGRGHEVLAVASPDPKVAAWARKAGIPHVPTFDGLREAAGATPDYLFSIVNDDVLPGEALLWPGRMAINYHDGPLPRYAGIHATSWALMAGETQHAVSWHVMTDRVDFGDVLAQEPFAITEADSAFTLNAKAYEAALASFRRLAGELESGSEVRTPQSEAERSFFGRHKRPGRAGVVQWSAGANDLLRQARALDFGPYDNPLCATRIWTGTRFLIAASAARTDTGPNALPGTILSVGPDWLRLSTGGDSDIRFTGLREVDGRAAELEESRFACARQLPEVDAADLEAIVALDASAHKWEKWWINRLSSLQPVQTPFISSLKSVKADPEAGVTVMDVVTPAGMAAPAQIAAFALYLARIGRTGRFDLPFHGGDQPCARTVAGKLFETHVPMRVDIDTGASFEAIRAAVASEMEALKKRPTYARDLAFRSTALRQISEVRTPHVWHAGIEFGDRSSGRAAIALVPSDTGCRLRFRSDVISGEQAAEIVAQFQEMLGAASSSPAAVGTTLNMLTGAERRRVLEDFCGESRDYERGVTLPELIARQVAARPNDGAVVFEGRTVSYAELDALSNRIAHRLRDAGVKPGVLVGVCLERSVELVASLVGVVKSGGAYVPLDPSYPAERLANMAEDAELTIVLTREHELGIIGGWDRGPIIRLDDGSLDGQPTTTPEPMAQESDPAYAIFTSGSTGRPKGAANAHTGIINRILWMQEYYQLAPGDRVLQKTPYSFDVSVWE